LLIVCEIPENSMQTTIAPCGDNVYIGAQ
jgi:hypothetical protein